MTTDGSGIVAYFNHDNKFQKVFMNSSLSQLVESMDAYKEVVRRTKEENGEDAFLDNDIPRYLQNWIENKLKDIDPSALDEQSHWWQEVQGIRAGKYD